MSLSAIAMWTGGRLVGGDADVGGVSIDTRTLRAGDLFVAIPGERTDGHAHAAAAVAAAATGLLVERQLDLPLPQVVVTDTVIALGDLASAWRAQQPVSVIGITGSNGKTTVKNLVAGILGLYGKTHVTDGNYNNELGLPLTLLAMPADCRYAVLEMGAGKPGDIAYLAAIAKPRVALVNNVAPAHLERMGGLEGVAETKGAIYRHLPAHGVAVINADDPFASFFAGLAGARPQLRFSLDGKAELQARLIESTARGQQFELLTPQGSAKVQWALAGRHNIANALAACAIAQALEVPLAMMVEGLAQARTVSGRLQRQPQPGGWMLIDDSYNANPGSVTAAIATLAELPGERWLVLGDMAELGAAARSLHAEIGDRAQRAGLERLFATGPLSAAAVAAFGPGGEHFTSREALAEALCKRLHAGVTCLVKGSRSSAMDQVTAMLKTKEGDSHAA